MSRDYTVGAADPTTAVVAVPTAPLAGNVVKVPADADPADVPKAIIELVNSLPKAADLATVAPSDPASAAVVGVSTKAAREDHQHKRELPAPLGVDKGKPVVVNVTGSGYTLGALPVDLATTAPADPAAAAVVGVGTTSARADHQHKKELPASVAADKDKILTLDATGLAPVWKAVPKELPVSGAANANHILGLDATGLIPQWEAVTTVTELKPAVANEAALPATGNTVGDIRITLDDGNMHVWVAATVTPAVAAHWDKIGPAAANVSMATAAPLDPAAAAAVGTSLAAAREDHVHKAELPAHVLADAAKHLAVTAAGTAVEWVAPLALATTAPADPAVTAVVGVGTTSARDDHVHKQELPAHTATDKHQSLWLGLAGTPEWRAPSPTTAPVNARYKEVPGFSTFNVNKASATPKVNTNKLANIPVEDRQFFKAGAVIRLTRMFKGKPHTFRIIKDWPAAVWTATDPIPEATWGPHGADEYFAWEDIEAVLAGPDDLTMGQWEYALPEIPPHVAADAGKTLVVNPTGTAIEWGTPKAPSPSISPLGVQFKVPLASLFTLNETELTFTNLASIPVEHRQFFVAGALIRTRLPLISGKIRTYRIVKDWPAAVWTAAPLTDATWGPHGAKEYFAWEDIRDALAEGNTFAGWEYSVPEVPPHTQVKNFNDILRVNNNNSVEWRSPTPFTEPTFTGDRIPHVGDIHFGPFGSDLQAEFANVYHSTHRALFKAGNVMKVTADDGTGDYYLRIIKDFPDTVFDTLPGANGFVDETAIGEATDYIAWEDMASIAAHRYKANPAGSGWLQGPFSIRAKAPVLPAFTAADAGKTLAINPAGNGFVWK